MKVQKSNTCPLNRLYPEEEAEADIERCSLKKVFLRNFFQFLIRSLLCSKVAPCTTITLLKMNSFIGIFPRFDLDF